MAYVKALTSTRAREFLATPEGRRKLLTLYLGTGKETKVTVDGKSGQSIQSPVEKQPDKK